MVKGECKKSECVQNVDYKSWHIISVQILSVFQRAISIYKITSKVWVSGKHCTCTRIWGFILFYDFAGTMPLTNKEKMSRRRAKVKADPELHRERKEKDRQRKITEFARDDEIKVNVMHRSGKNWKWPQPVDHIYYFCKDIVKKINPPTVVGARGQFAFESFA